MRRPNATLFVATLGTVSLVISFAAADSRTAGYDALSDQALARVHGSEGSAVKDDSYTCEEANLQSGQVTVLSG